MFHSKPFKKDITPFAKGGKVVKHVGKGAREQSPGRGFETMTGGNPYERMANRYPKSAPEPAPESAMPAPPVPMGSRGGSAPTAMMPSFMGEDEEA